jgi:hypothetical protein
LSFDIPKQGDSVAAVQTQREPKQKTPHLTPKNDPRLVAAARESRDRWLEQVNATPFLSHGKYEVTRPVPHTRTATMVEVGHATPFFPAPIAA